jgi:hypothetical protein
LNIHGPESKTKITRDCKNASAQDGEAGSNTSLSRHAQRKVGTWTTAQQGEKDYRELARGLGTFK